MSYDGTIKLDTGIDTKGAEQGLKAMDVAIAAGMAAALATLGKLGAEAIKMGIEWESAFAGVVKTVDATDKELQTISDGIRNMAKEMPMAASELAGIAEAAGQLGIETSNILGFTETMADLGVATNLTGEEAASMLAKFANITGMPQDQFDRLGSTIVALGNNLATTEADIVSMGLRLAGAGTQVGMTEAQILSFAGALSSVGIEAEAGGSAFSKVMIDMQLAVETGGDKLEELQGDIDDLADKMEQSADAHKENIASIEAEAKAAENLADKVFELAETENKSAADKLRLKQHVDLLNESVEGLNLAYDEQNDTLNMTQEQTRALIALQKEQLLLQARQEYALELAKEQAKAENDLLQAYTKRKEIEEKLADAQARKAELDANVLYNTSEQRKELNSLNKDVRTYTRDLNDATEVEKNAQDQVDASTDSYNNYADAVLGAGDAVEDAAKKVNQATSDASESMDDFGLVTSENVHAFINSMELGENALKRHNDALENYVFIASDSFGKVAADSKISLDQIKENLLFNIQAMEDWSNNMQILAERGVHGGFLETLRSAGPEARLTVAALVDATDEELSELGVIFEGSAQAGTNAYLTGIGEASKRVPAETAMLIATTRDSLEAAAQAHNFPQVGTDIINQIINAIADNEDLSDAARSKIEALRETLTAAAQEGRFDESVLPALEQMSDVIKNNESVPDSTKHLWDTTRTTFESHIASNDLTPIGPKIMDPLANSVEQNTALSDAMERVIGVASKKAEEAVSGAGYDKPGVATVKQMGEGAELSDALELSLQRRITAAKEKADTAVDEAGFDDTGNKPMEKMASAVTESTHVEDAITEKMPIIREHADNQVDENEFDGVGTHLSTDVSESIKKDETVVDASKGLIDDAYDAAETAVKNTAFSSVGESIADGVAAGIRSGTSAVTSAVSAMIDAALAAAHTAADSNSPARRFIPLGENLDEGVAVGVGRNRYTPQAAASLMEDTYAAVRSTHAQAGSAQSSVINYNSTASSQRGGDVTFEDGAIRIEGAPINNDLDAERTMRRAAERTAKDARWKGVFNPI